MIRLALLRHGHTDWNREGRVQGRTDIPLDAEAEQQLAGYCLPNPWNNAALWASPLARAQRTAELVGGQPPQTAEALTEMNWGDWEGQHGTILRADPASGYRDIEDWGWDFTPPNGESPAAVRQRVIPWAKSLRRDAVAVCHIGIMRVFLAHATGWNFSGAAPFAIKRNRLYVIEITKTWRFLPGPVRLKERS